MVALPTWLVPDPVPAPVPRPDGRLGPPVPLGRRIRLADRGTTFVRELEGPPGAPTVLLLHGWLASAGLNWFRVFAPLSEHFRVVAVDHRGHGRGIRSSRPFRLADCADDAAMVAAELGISRVIAVGYSMGGPVAQLLWRRHRPLVDGLVLCATAPAFVPRTRERLLVQSIASMSAGGTRLGGLLARPLHHTARRLPRIGSGAPRDFREWAVDELRRHDWRMLIEAAHAVGTYDAWTWIHTIDVPTAVVLSTRDRAVPTRTQLAMAEAIPHATLHPVDDGHAVCARPGFIEPIVAACLDVAGRAEQPT